MLRQGAIVMAVMLAAVATAGVGAEGSGLERMRANMAGSAAPVEGGRCPAVTLAVRATGYATWLGAFTAEQEQCADPAGPDPLAFTDGTYRWTNADGGGIFGRYNGRLVPAEGTEEHGFFLLDGRFTIDGGSGRFAGASGHGVAEGLLNPATGQFNIALDASLSLPGEPGR
jgi:hypothetical protein